MNSQAPFPISVSWLGKRADVVPDAVIRSAKLRRRIFVELDRSTKDLGRIRECLDRYVQVFRALDLGGDVPSLLFVIRSAARKANVEALGRTLGTPLDLVVLREPGAVAWLREEVLSIAPEAPRRSREETFPMVARRAYLWMIQLDRVMRANGMHDALNGDEPALMKEGRDRLHALYHSPPLLRVEEVAKLLRINRKSAYAAVESGAIPGVVRIGRSIRVSRDAVLDWLRGQGGVSRSRRQR
jgi:excisionase family DNA binding protein